jgi:hypothetical protein
MITVGSLEEARAMGFGWGTLVYIGSWDLIRLARDVAVLGTEVLRSAETDRSNVSFALHCTNVMNMFIGSGTARQNLGSPVSNMPAKCGIAKENTKPLRRVVPRKDKCGNR